MPFEVLGERRLPVDHARRIYARYSSDNQREASIDDQVEVCRRAAPRGAPYPDRWM